MKSYAWEKRDFLKKFHRCGKSQELHLIESCDKDEVLAISEVIDNVVNNPESLTTRQRQRLKKHKKLYLKVIDKKTDWKVKKKLLIAELKKHKRRQKKNPQQKGRGLPAIIAGLSAGLPLLWDFAKNTFGSSSK